MDKLKTIQTAVFWMNCTVLMACAGTSLRNESQWRWKMSRACFLAEEWMHHPREVVDWGLLLFLDREVIWTATHGFQTESSVICITVQVQHITFLTQIVASHKISPQGKNRKSADRGTPSSNECEEELVYRVKRWLQRTGRLLCRLEVGGEGKFVLVEVYNLSADTQLFGKQMIGLSFVCSQLSWGSSDGCTESPHEGIAMTPECWMWRREEDTCRKAATIWLKSHLTAAKRRAVLNIVRFTEVVAKCNIWLWILE